MVPLSLIATVGLSYHRRQGSRPYSLQAGVTRPGLIAGALGPSVVSLNTNKTSSSFRSQVQCLLAVDLAVVKVYL